MVISNIDDILKKTSEATQYSPDIIMSVVDHQFKSFHNYIDNPTSPGIRFPYFGVFRPKYNAVTDYLKRLIRKLRKDRNNEKLKQRFRAY